MKKLSTLLIAVLVAAGLLRMCVYTVNEREYALVFALGELKTVISEPGLHVKLPPPLQNISTSTSASSTLMRPAPTSSRRPKRRTF